MTANEDFLFAQESQALGFVTEAQVREAFDLQRRMSEDLQLDERLGVILVKRGYMAEDQARRVAARIEPKGAKPGQITGYRLIEVVGRGAMGTVYRAIHLGLHREVALKILRQDLAGDRTQVERLKAEAAMLASLDHPNIVRALDAGESNGFPYVAMEFVEGETLRDRLRQGGPMPEKEALRITRDLADALERARRKGVVHRDVKPGNILIARDGTPKLMDLGLAKGPIDLGLTQHGATVGTPQYIAPEQAIDPRKADTRSDIYALGATLYAMLTGQPPFDGQTLAEILTKVLYEVPTPVRSLRPEVSPETGYLVERMMLRDPSLRYATPAMVVSDIDHLIQGNSILPQGFSGNWEAFLLRRRVKRYAVAGALAILCAVGTAFGVRLTQEYFQRIDARERVTAEIQDELLDLPLSTDGKAAIERRFRRADELASTARRVGAANRAEMETRRKVLWRELEDLHAFEVTEARSRALENTGEFAAAHRLFAEFLPSVPRDEPARHRADAAVRAFESRSDRALLETKRGAFLSRPESLAAVRLVHERWADAVASKFAPTGIALAERESSSSAAEAARSLAVGVESRAESVNAEAIATRVVAHQLADLRRDLRLAEEGAAEELARRAPSLTAGGYFSATDIERLVREPFRAATLAAESAVSAEAARLVREAASLESGGATPKALEVLGDFVEAAGKEQAYPETAQGVMKSRTEMERRTHESLATAEVALAKLLDALVARLRADDLPGYAAAVAEALAKPDLYRPVLATIEELRSVPEAFDRIHALAIAGLKARVGSAKANWLDPVALRDGTRERNWEIRSVDPVEQTFVVVAYPGNTPQPPKKHALLDLADEEITRLAGLSTDPKDKGDFALRALHALSRLPDPPPDFYARRDQLRSVTDLFERAGLAGSALSQWAVARLAAVQVTITEAEKLAESMWVSGETYMAQPHQHHSAAFYYNELRKEPLSFTEVAKSHRATIEQRMIEVHRIFAVDSLSLLFPGAAVTPLPGPRGESSDEVEIRFDFHVASQLENFIPGTGLARLVPAGPRGVVTPETQPGDMSLLLLPDNEGEVVKGQGLALEAPDDPGFTRSLSFLYWPRQPCFLGIGLNGVWAGCLSLDPMAVPFAKEVPLLERDRQKAPPNYYGRGRGILFRAAPEAGDPTAWPWDEQYQGRHFLPKDVQVKERHDQLKGHWFLFDANREKPYRVKFTHAPEQGRVALYVDDREVWYAQGAAYRTPKPSGRIEILSFTTCMIDDLVLTCRISKSWLERMRAKSGAEGVSTRVKEPVAKPR